MILVAVEASEDLRPRLERMLVPRFAATALADLAEDQKPDVVLLAMDQTPDSLPAEWLALPLLLLVNDPQPGWAQQALHWGVRGVLPIEADATELAAAVEAVAAGLLVVHPHDAEVLFRPTAIEVQAQHAEPLLDPLTPRETEILRLLALGIGNKEIAARLNISEHTVKFHVASILSKLGVGTRTEAVTAGLRQGLILL